MPSTRRDFLRLGGLAAAGTVAGCLSSARPADAPETTDDGTTTEEETTAERTGNGTLPDGGEDPADGTRPAGTGGPGVTLVSTDDAPDLPITPSIEVIESVATEEHPPRLRASVTNDGESSVHVGEGRAVLFQFVTADSEALTLLPTGGDYDVEPGCWRLRSPVATTMEYRMLELGPGETVSAELDLYGAAGGDGCLPVGNYRFVSTYNVADGPGSLDEGEHADWGFSVALE